MKLLSFILLIGLLSCKTGGVKKVRIYRGIELPIASNKFIPYFDSLLNSNEYEILQLTNGSKILALKENFNGIPYYNAISFTNDNGIITSLQFDVMTKFSFDMAPSKDLSGNSSMSALDQINWFSNPQNDELVNYEFENYLVHQIELKYGNHTKMDTVETTQIGGSGFINYLVGVRRIWETKDIDIGLIRIIQKNSGNIRLKLLYALNKEYIEKNKIYLDQLRSQASSF